MLDQEAAPAAVRVALVVGATDLVGREVLAALLTDKHDSAVHSIGLRTACAARTYFNSDADVSPAPGSGSAGISLWT